MGTENIQSESHLLRNEPVGAAEITKIENIERREEGLRTFLSPISLHTHRHIHTCMGCDKDISSKVTNNQLDVTRTLE